MFASIIRTLFPVEGNSILMYKLMKKYWNVQYPIWALLLFVLWLSLHTVVFAESEVIQASKEFVLSNVSPIPAVTHSTKVDDTLLSDKAIKVTKTDVQYAVDFSYLQTVVPNSIAWLYQPNTDINQPVMYSDNPKYYYDGRSAIESALMERFL